MNSWKAILLISTPSHTHQMAHLGFLAGLAVGAVRLVVQLLGDHAQELGLVFVPIVVRGADADELRETERDRNKRGVSLTHAEPGQIRGVPLPHAKLGARRRDTHAC